MGRTGCCWSLCISPPPLPNQWQSEVFRQTDSGGPQVTRNAFFGAIAARNILYPGDLARRKVLATATRRLTRCMAFWADGSETTLISSLPSFWSLMRTCWSDRGGRLDGRTSALKTVLGPAARRRTNEAAVMAAALVSCSTRMTRRLEKRWQL